MKISCLEASNALDLNHNVHGKGLDSECRTSWRIGCEELGIDLIHGSKVTHIRKENGSLDNVLILSTCSFKNVSDVLEHLLGLFLDTTVYDLLGGWVEGNLTAEEEHVALLDALGVWANGEGSFVSENNFSHFCSI